MRPEINQWQIGASWKQHPSLQVAWNSCSHSLRIQVFMAHIYFWCLLGWETLASLASLHHFISDSRRSVDGITTKIFQDNFYSSAGQFHSSPVFRAAHAHATLAIKEILHIGNKSSAQTSHNNLRFRID